MQQMVQESVGRQDVIMKEIKWLLQAGYESNSPFSAAKEYLNPWKMRPLRQIAAGLH
jgi:hypothetical protein